MFTSTMIKSLILNHRTNERLHVYIFYKGDGSSKERLLKTTISKNVSVELIEINKYVLKKINTPNNYINLTAHYYRLLIPYLLPENINKVIYLDCDMIVLGDISKLWGTDTGDDIVFAVQDSRIRVVACSWGGIENYRELNIRRDSKYFNSGVMLINLKRWREEGISEKVIKCCEENKKYVKLWDQYGLNVVLANRWKELDPRWNQFPEVLGHSPYIIHYTVSMPTLTDPIIHYTQRIAKTKTLADFFKMIRYYDKKYKEPDIF